MKVIDYLYNSRLDGLDNFLASKRVDSFTPILQVCHIKKKHI